jgi:hypothetical protein
VIWQHGETKLQAFLNHLNARRELIKFTMEKEDTGSIPFLDVLVWELKELTMSVYRKKTHIYGYINYLSYQHPRVERVPSFVC